MARKATYNQDKIKELRMSLVESCLAILNEEKRTEKWSQLKKDLILKMSPRVMPILHAGREDDERLIPEPIYGGKSVNNDISKHNGDQEDISANEED